jgi:glycosyltransferase involved in cell wall biosynthesis
MEKISTVILTKNEEQNIERCIKSILTISDEIIVVDCLSDDRTVEIVRKYTDRVYLNPWPGFSRQRMFALEKTTHDWVLWIDADEEASPELLDEIRSLEFDQAGYAIPRLVHYLGRWIRHGGWYPDYTVRLFNKHKGMFTDVLVHEAFSLNGTSGRLKAPLFHYPYRSIAHHLEKMNHYTDLASEQMRRKGKKTGLASIVTHSIFRFIRMYILKLGMLDGLQGLLVAMLGAVYVFLKYAKLFEKNIGPAAPSSGDSCSS